MKYCIINWQDPTSYDDWDDKSEHIKEANNIISVGILLHEDKSKIVIALSWDQDGGDYSQSLIIPIALIKSMRILSKDDIRQRTRQTKSKPARS